MAGRGLFSGRLVLAAASAMLLQGLLPLLRSEALMGRKVREGTLEEIEDAGAGAAVIATGPVDAAPVVSALVPAATAFAPPAAAVSGEELT